MTPLREAAKHLWLLCLFSVALVGYHPSNAFAVDSTPSPEFSSQYVLHKGPMELGETTRRLYLSENGSYVFYSESKPVGIARLFTKSNITEVSEWIYVQGQLRPLNYTYDRRGDSNLRQVKINFDWQKLTATSTVDSPWQISVHPGTLDKLLYHLALVHDLQQGRQELTYSVADSGTIKSYLFTVVGEETVTTELGTHKTIKLERNGGSHETIVWCAPQLGYIPVKLEQDGVTLTIKSLSRVPQLTAAEPATAKNIKNTDSEPVKAKR
jgi:hypothetical protein